MFLTFHSKLKFAVLVVLVIYVTDVMSDLIYVMVYSATTKLDALTKIINCQEMYCLTIYVLVTVANFAIAKYNNFVDVDIELFNFNIPSWSLRLTFIYWIEVLNNANKSFILISDN